MNWDLGDVPGRRGDHEAVPEGSINFTTAEKPVFLIFLRPPSTSQIFDTRVVEMTLVVESWTLYKIEKGRGLLRYS